MRKRFLCLLLTLLLCLSLAPVSQAAGGSAYDRPGQKLAALTFDDGPGPYSDRIMDTLAAHGAKATFFMNGYKVRTYAKQIQRMVAEGHQIANHTYNHPVLASSSATKVRNEITGTANALTEVTGLTGTGNTGFYLRPPYGSWNNTTLSLAGVPVIWCTVDSGDWKYQDAARLTSYTGTVLQDGDIVILHEIHKTTAQGLDALLTKLDKRGFTLVTLEDLFWRRGITPQAGKIYYSAKNTGVNRCERALWFDESKLSTHWAAASIDYVRQKGLMHNNLYGEFTPNFPLTRGMFVTCLGRLAGVEGDAASTGYRDLSADHYAAPYAAWAKEADIMRGLPDGRFAPDDPITRQELATAMARYAALCGAEGGDTSAPVYNDQAAIADWAKDGVALCGQLGLLVGANGTFSPTDTATRAMGAVILQRLNEAGLRPQPVENGSNI